MYHRQPIVKWLWLYCRAAMMVEFLRPGVLLYDSLYFSISSLCYLKPRSCYQYAFVHQLYETVLSSWSEWNRKGDSQMEQVKGKSQRFCYTCKIHYLQSSLRYLHFQLALYRTGLFDSQCFVIFFLPYLSDFLPSLKHRAKVEKIAVSQKGFVILAEYMTIIG